MVVKVHVYGVPVGQGRRNVRSERRSEKRRPKRLFRKPVKQIRAPLSTRLARVRLSPLGSAQSHPVSRFNVGNLSIFVRGFNSFSGWNTSRGCPPLCRASWSSVRRCPRWRSSRRGHRSTLCMCGFMRHAEFHALAVFPVGNIRSQCLSRGG